MNLLSVLLQTTAPGATGGGQGNQWSSILMIVAMVAIFYFFMIRPQQKKQKEMKKMRESMKSGDKVITSGGIYGKIKEVNENDFLIEISDGVRVKVDKASVFIAADDIQISK